MSGGPDTAASAIRRFNRAAHGYAAAARAQATLSTHVLAACPTILPAGAEVIDVGCGTGLLTRALAARYPQAHVTGLDPAPAMLEAAASYAPPAAPAAPIAWVRGAVPGWRPANAPRLVVSSAALHWVHPLGDAFDALAGWCAPSSELVLQLMTTGTLAELHEARRVAAPDVPPAAALPSADHVVATAERHGFAVHTAAQHGTQLRATSVDALLDALRAQGVTAGPYSRGPRPLQRAELEALRIVYRDRFAQPDGRVAATYRTICLSLRPRAATGR